MTNRMVMDWFDGLETVLAAKSKLSGLFEHGPTIGQAREFLVTRLLKTILPASVHVGSGKVIDHRGSSSKQIDIVIYDPRFPMMKVEGGGLYFVEGTLATIEVKSTINSAELNASLNNCKSVLELSPYAEHPEEAEKQIQFYIEKGNLSHADAEQRFWYRFRPATYIFAFSGMSLDTTATCVKEWWEGTGCACSTYFPVLPRVITSGNIVGIVNDGRINLTSDQGVQHVMAVFATERRFRWLALHLMDAVSQRLGLRNFAERFDYRLTDYYPFDEYMAEIVTADTRFLDRQMPQPPAA